MMFDQFLRERSYIYQLIENAYYFFLSRIITTSHEKLAFATLTESGGPAAKELPEDEALTRHR